MPRYRVQDSETGRTLVIEGDSPPDDNELAELFKTSSMEDSKPAAPVIGMTPEQAQAQRQLAISPPQGYSPWGAGDPAAGLREMVGASENPAQAAASTLVGMAGTGLRAGTTLIEIPGKLARLAASDVVALGQNMAHDLETEDVPKAEYGGNLLYGPPTRTGEFPADTFMRTLANTNPNLSVAGHAANMFADMSGWGATGLLPNAYKRLIAAGFTLDMIYHAPQQAWELGGELGKPENEQDKEKIAQLEAALLAAPFFIQQGGKHALLKERSPYARSQQQTTEVHGNVRPQPGEGEQAVPTEEGGTGIQPSGTGPQGVRPQGTPSEVPLKEQAPKLGLTEEAEASLKKDWTFATANDRLEMAGGDQELAQKNWWAMTPEDKNTVAQNTGVELTEIAPKKPAEPEPEPTTDDINARIVQLSEKQKQFMLLDESEQQELANLRKQRDAEESKHFTEEDLKVINQEREGMDVPIDVKPGVPELKEDEPFAPNKRRPGVFMQPNRRTRSIEIYPEAFNEWTEGLDPSVRDAAIRARLTEERIHLDVSDDSAKAYWNSLSGWEKKLAAKFYLGEQSGRGYNETLLGHEAFRTRIQALRGLTPSEIAERAGLEKWTLKGLRVIQTAIQGLRETYIRRFGSEADRALLRQHLDALGRVEQGINLARGFITGEPPAAMSKSAWKRIQEHQQKVKEQLDKEARGELPEEELTARIAKLNRQGEVSYLTDTERNELAGLRLERDRRTRWEEPGAINKTKREIDSYLETGAELIGTFDSELDAFNSITRKGIKPGTGSFNAEDGRVYYVPELDKYVALQDRRDFLHPGDQQAFPAALNRRRTKAEFDAQKKRDLEKLMQLKAAKELGVEVPKIPWSEAAPGMAEQPSVPESERVGTGHDYRGVTPGGVNWMVAKNLVSDKVGFDHFLSDAKAEFGPKVESGSLFELYVDRAVKLLGGARAQKIEDLLSKLRLWGAVLGSRRASYNVKGLIPEPPGTARAELSRVERQIANYRRKADDLEKLAQEHDIKIQEEPKYQKTQQEMFQESRSAAQGSVERHHAVRAKNLRARATKLRQEADLLEKGATPKAAPTAAPESHEGRLFRFKSTPEASENRYEYIAQNKPFIEVPRTITGKSDAPLPAGETPKTYGDKLRARAISAIIQKLVGTVSRPSLSRTDITPDDLRWTEGNKAFREVPEDLHDDPVLLGHMLTEGGGERRDVKFVEAGGKKVRSVSRNPETVTKRLVLMVDPRSGTAYLVDAYRSARHGVMIGDPASRAGLHSPVETMLKRYRPVYSMLLDHPVKNFFKKFESLEDFNDKFGKEAIERAEQSESEAQPPESVSAIEGTPGIHPKEKRGIFERRFRLTPREAQVVYESFDAVENPQGAREMLDELVRRSERHGEFTKTRGADLMAARERLNNLRRQRSGMGQEKMDLLREYGREGETINVEPGQLEFKKQAQRRALDTRIEKAQEAVFKLEELQKQGMTPRHWLLLNAIRKVGNRVFQEYPRQKFEEWKAFSKANPEVRMPFNEYADTSERALLAETLNQLYDASRQKPTKTNFVTEAARRSFAESQAGAEPAASPSEFSRELELPERGGRPFLKERISQFRRPELAAPEVKAERAAEIPEPILKREGNWIPGLKRRPTAEDLERYRYLRRQQREAGPQARQEPGAIIRRGTKRQAKEMFNRAIYDPVRAYDEWMVDRIARKGGPVSRAAAEGFNYIIDRAKQIYGGLTPKLDEAKRAAGKLNAGTRWLRSIRKVPGAAFAGTSRLFDALDSLANQNRGRTGARMARHRRLTLIPTEAQDVAEKLWEANYEAGQVVQPVTPGFIPSGAPERNFTSIGYDTIRSGRGDMFEKWVTATAKANGWTGSRALGTRHLALNPAQVRQMFTDLKEALDEPEVDSAKVEKIKQDFSMKLPNVVTHIKSGGQWHELIHSSPFNYIENAAQRASHVRAFREQFPNTPIGRAHFRGLMDDLNTELDPRGQDALIGLIKGLQGRPTDSYTGMGPLSPTRTLGGILRSGQATIGHVLAKMVLTSQMATQLGETMTGATPQFLGVGNTARAWVQIMKRYKALGDELELAGKRNRVIYDWSWDTAAPIRSASRIAGNVLSKGFGEQFFNELQEMTAATTAQVVAERIETGRMSPWEKRMLPETFRSMGFNERQIADMMAGDPQLLQQFQRKASAFLTSGNKAIAEGSKLGANRLFNSLFRFQTYPMMKMNQFHRVTGRFAEQWFTDKGTFQGKVNSAEQLARFVAGNTLQGALTVGIVSLAMQGLFGTEIKKNEAKDSWVKFLTESFLSSLSGPFYMMWRGARYNGLNGIGEQATRMIFPYAMAREMMDAAQGEGIYKDLSIPERIAKFVKQKTPGLQMIASGAALVGLGAESQKMDAAKTAFWRWRRETMGWSREDSNIAEDDHKEFRKQMKRVVDALQSGDEQKFYDARDAAIGAVPEGDDAVKAWKQSIGRRNILKGPKGEKLTEEQLDALTKHIGQKAVELLMDYDDMIEAASDFTFPAK